MENEESSENSEVSETEPEAEDDETYNTLGCDAEEEEEEEDLKVDNVEEDDDLNVASDDEDGIDAENTETTGFQGTTKESLPFIKKEKVNNPDNVRNNETVEDTLKSSKYEAKSRNGNHGSVYQNTAFTTKSVKLMKTMETELKKVIPKEAMKPDGNFNAIDGRTWRSVGKDVQTSKRIRDGIQVMMDRVAWMIDIHAKCKVDIYGRNWENNSTETLQVLLGTYVYSVVIFSQTAIT